MITAEQIQTILAHAAAAPTTIGQAYTDRPAFDALVAIGQGLAKGQTLQWTPIAAPAAAPIAPSAPAVTPQKFNVDPTPIIPIDVAHPYVEPANTAVEKLA